ncbi:MAG: SPOR domain-containing protein [Rhodoferax sp.]|nr:SPOR domain-containing protein [Rhodoferax sp.]
MAFFKFRKGGQDQSAASPQPESIEAMRRRAKHRLVGAAVLVLVGVVGLPVLFDRQPRPISVDIPIEIPDKNKVKPLPGAAGNAASASALVGSPPPALTSAPKSPAMAVAPAVETVKPSQIEEKVPAVPVGVVPTASAVAAKRDTPSKVDPPAPVAAKPAVAVDEAVKAQALLDGKDAPKEPAASDGRFVVQVGAFSDAAKAREARLKVERAGMKTYTQVVETKDGRRTRVRVGPFADRAEADKAAIKIKRLDLAAAVLVL